MQVLPQTRQGVIFFVNNRRLVIMHQNTRSISNKMLPIEVILTQTNVDLLLVTEHWLNVDQMNGFFMPGFKTASHFCRSVDQHGGSAIFCKRDFTCKVVPVEKYCVENVLECCCIELPLLKTLVIVIYSPPSACRDLFLELCSQMFDDIVCNSKLNVVIGGDFNIDLLVNSKKKKLWIDLLVSCGLKPTIYTPTRITSESQTCIDNFLIRHDNDFFEVKNLNLSLSDHLTQFIYLGMPSLEGPCRTDVGGECARNMCEKNMSTFCDVIARETWDALLSSTCPNAVSVTLSHIVDHYFKACFPVIQVRRRKVDKCSKWLTEDTLYLKNHLSCVSDLAHKYPQLKQYCKDLNRLYRNKLTFDKRGYFDAKIIGSNNRTKMMWSVVSELQGKWPSRDKMSLMRNGISLSSVQAAEEFNAHFTLSHLPQVTRGIDMDFLNDNVPLCQNSFFLSPITEPDVISLIGKLSASNSTGLDQFSNRLLKKCKFSLARPLCHLINLCFVSGTFPQHLKVSKVLPLHKKGDTHNIANYRAISLVSSVSKVIEMAINQQLMGFFEKFDLLSSDQHGFLKGKSVDTALFEFHSKIVSDVDNRKCSFGLFIDFSRAFDCVNFEVLLAKLYRYGVRGPALNLLTSYLDNRQQVVQVNGIISEPCVIKAGVPQGSILGPSLYVIYASDLVSYIKRHFDVHVTCYADDTNILITTESIDSAYKLAKLVYDRVSLWSEKNFLNLNSDKTVSVIFKNVGNPPTLIPASSLNTSVKILGVTFDYNLQWSTHIENLCVRLRQNCYALRTLKNHCSKSILKAVYFASVHSHLRYGILLWGLCGDSQRAFVLQKYAIRIIEHLAPRQSCRQSFKDLGILTLPGIYLYEICCFVFKNRTTFSRNRVNHSYSTRFKDVFISDHHSTSLYQKGIFFNGCKIFNALPDSIKSAPNISIFRNKVRQFFIQKNCYSVSEFFM